MTTKYQELIAIANSLAGEDVSGDHPRTVAGAIDAITDALAGQDVDGGQTIASAIAALAPYVDGNPVLVEKSITENGTYDPADDEADGYSSVEVNVSGGGGGNITSYVYFNPSSVTGLALTVNGQPVELANSEMGEWFKEFTAPAGAVVEYTSTPDDTPPTLYVYGSDEDIT